jgi:hypothetical protein
MGSSELRPKRNLGYKRICLLMPYFGPMAGMDASVFTVLCHNCSIDWMFSRIAAFRNITATICVRAALVARMHPKNQRSLPGEAGFV